MNPNSISILTAAQVADALAGQERDIVLRVADAYRTHASGDSVLPHSLFLRFPGLEKERIIALPAYLGGGAGLAGMKWISSFPGNLERGLERASAVLLLNALETGRVYAVLESSLVSAVRTAASAALGADVLLGETTADSVGLVGCGPINLQVLRFLRVVRPSIRRVVLFDLDSKRTEQFRDVHAPRLGFEDVVATRSLAELLDSTRLVSFATTAVKPHVPETAPIAPGTLILHVSLRDLPPSWILDADNVVDDVDHVCRANTSLHLAEQASGHRSFIRASLGEILLRKQPAHPPVAKPLTVFSPFGLGILDLAVGQLAYERASTRGGSTTLENFHPEPVLGG